MTFKFSLKILIDSLFIPHRIVYKFSKMNYFRVVYYSRGTHLLALQMHKSLFREREVKKGIYRERDLLLKKKKHSEKSFRTIRERMWRSTDFAISITFTLAHISRRLCDIKRR